MLFPNLVNHDGRPLDQVQLTGMLMSCVIGIFPSERSRKQPVNIDMCLYLDTRKAAQSASIHDTIDYASAVKEVAFILDHCEFQLIETAVEAICRHFLWTYQTDHHLPAVEAILVRISKPSALTHGIVPAVQIMRHKDDYQMQATKTGNVGIFTVHSAQDSALHLLVTDDEGPINVKQMMPSAANVLPFGRWNLNGQTIKSRTPVSLADDSEKIFHSLTTTPQTGRILLIQSLPAIG